VLKMVESRIKCSFCGYEFDEKEGEAACSACFSIKGCTLIKCPNCNFEMAPDPEWVKRFREKWGRKK